MTDIEYSKRLVSDACLILANAGLTELYTGHVSRRLNDDEVVIPVHRHDDGRGLESMTPEHVTRVTPGGNPLEGDEPPGEFPIHGAILNRREDVESIAHAHPLYATGLATACVPLEPASLDAAFFGGRVPVHDPGPRLLHDTESGIALAETLGSKEAVLIRGHGAVTTGKSVAAATVRMWLLERAARIQVIVMQLGDVEPFDTSKGDFLSGSGEGFLQEAFAFLRREHLGVNS